MKHSRDRKHGAKGETRRKAQHEAQEEGGEKHTGKRKQFGAQDRREAHKGDSWKTQPLSWSAETNKKQANETDIKANQW